MSGTLPQGNVQAIGLPNTKDYPRLVFGAPYHTTVAIAEIIEPSVQEAVEGMLPSLVPPYVQDAANAAVATQAVLLTGSTMTGPLFISPTMPTQPSQAASKSYVDTMLSTAGVPEVPAVPAGQTWGRQTGQWVALPTSIPYLPLSGGTMTGAINMSGNNITNLPAVPILPNGAAPAQWVLNQIAASTLYQGIWDADANAPDLTQPSTHQNSFTWIVKTTSTTGHVVSQPIPGLQGLTVFNGDTVIYSSMAGQFQLLQAGGLTVTEADARYVMLAGSTMTGPLVLSRDPVGNMDAATRQWVLANTAFPEAPNDGQVYGRNGLNHSWIPSLPVSGGILTGALTLAGNASTNLNPVPLQQLNSVVGNYVPLAGNVSIIGPITMSGVGANLILNSNASANLQAVPLQQLTSTLAAYAPINSPTFTGTVTIPTGASIAGYAPIASPALTGTPTAPTAAFNTSTTQLATTAYVKTGVTNGSNAPAGQIGEYQSTQGGTVSLTATTFTVLAQVSLTAGDWEVEGWAYYTTGSGSNVTILQQYVGTSATTAPALGNGGYTIWSVTFPASSAQYLPTGRARYNLTTTTTLYIVGWANFSTGTITAQSLIQARRVR